jgi:hypothetical protein
MSPQRKFVDSEVLTMKALADKGFSTREIAEVVHSSSAAVSYWLRKIACGQLPSATVHKAPPLQRQSLIQHRRKIVKRLARSLTTAAGRVTPRHPSAGLIKRALHDDYNIKVSKQTVLRDLAALGFYCRVRPKVPTVAKSDELRRVKFARCVLSSGLNLRKIVFSDEKMFNTNDHTCRTQWVNSDSELLSRERARWPVKVHVWGAIGVDFRRIVVSPEFGSRSEDNNRVTAFRVNAAAYKRLCLRGVAKEMRERGLVFQQDGAGPHTGGQAYLEKRDVQVLEGWPPRSPQLSPIEDMWGVMQARVSNHQPHDREGLVNAIVEEWEHAEGKLFNTAVLSFEKRLKKTIRCKGKL